MQLQKVATDRLFLGQWLVANVVGFVVGGMLAISGFVVAEALGADEFSVGSLQMMVATAAGGAVMGFFLGGGLGTAQYLLLRSRLEDIDRYAPATALASGLTMAVGLPFGLQLAPWDANPLAIALFFGLLPGMAIGLAQGRVLRSQVNWAAPWAFVSALAFLAGMFVVGLLSAEGREIVALGAGGLTIGLISGLYLLRQLRH